MECGNQEGFWKIRSEHDNGAEDRVWEWSCRRIAQTDFDRVHWSDWTVNDFDQPFMFLCPSNEFLCGVDSYHDNGPEDRRFNFKCCHSPSHFTRNCQITDYTNWFDQPIHAELSHGSQVFTGVYSYHDNGAE